MMAVDRKKSVLCYGDSNTWAFVPGTVDFTTLYVERYDRETRWTGRLQQILADKYYIIEEGLNGRTTNLDYEDVPGRNGETYLTPCLYSHAPLDLVILFLGANDLKVEFNRSAADVADGLDALIRLIKATIYGPDMRNAPKILLIGYPEIVNDSYVGPEGEKIFAGATAKSQELLGLTRALAEQHGCSFFDLASKVELSEIDGIHLEPAGHARVAEVLADEVTRILGAEM